MHYYIYPKGGHGRTLAEMVKFLEKAEISFIDDGIPEITLEKQKEEIKKSGDKVLLVLEQKNPKSITIMNTLIQKLNDAGVKNYTKAALYYSTHIVEWCREELKRRGWDPKNTIGIGVYNLGGEKHLGLVDEELKKQGFNILYLCCNDISYAKYSAKNAENSFAIPLLIEHFDLIDYIWGLYLTTPCNYKNPKVKYFYTPHGVADMAENIMRFGWFEEAAEMLRHTDYIFTTTKRESNIIKQVLRDYLLDTNRVVDAGYPAFEITMPKYEKDPEVIRDSVLVALHDDDVPFFKESLRKLLERGVRVIFREGYSWNPKVVEGLKSEFGSHKNFCLDDGEKISNESYKRALCVFISASSVGYTFPMTTLHPAVIFYANKEIAKRNYKGFSYFNPQLHLIASNVDEVLKAYDDIKANEAKWSEQILAHRNEELFNYNFASSFIAKTIKDIHTKEKE